MLVDEVENVLTIDPSKLEKIQSKKKMFIQKMLKVLLKSIIG